MSLKFKALALLGKVIGIGIHHSASSKHTTVAEIHQWHINKGWAGCGYHYLIDHTGRLHVGRPPNTTPAHAEGFNRGYLAICLIGNYEVDEPSPEMMHTLKQLVATLVMRHKLPISAVKGHYQLNATSCPGKNVIRRLPVLLSLIATQYLKKGA